MSLDRVVAAWFAVVGLSVAVAGCSAPKVKPPLPPVIEGPLLPKAVYFGKPPYKYKGLGVVRASKTFSTLNLEMTDEIEAAYCKKVFVDAVNELLQLSKTNGGDGVADVHSVVFLADGRQESFDRPECTDDGEEGEVLVQGVAIKWVRTAAQPGPAASSAPGVAPTPVSSH